MGRRARFRHAAQPALVLFDGLFFSISDAIVLTYLTLYLLALSATSAQIGFMAALGSLNATLLLIPGAMLAERLGRRILIVVMAGGGISRISLLRLAVTPFLFDAPYLRALRAPGDGQSSVERTNYSIVIPCAAGRIDYNRRNERTATACQS